MSQGIQLEIKHKISNRAKGGTFEVYSGTPPLKGGGTNVMHLSELKELYSKRGILLNIN